MSKSLNGIERNMTQRRLIIAGTHSGVGKTTIAIALMAALRRRGWSIQPFKVGPDYIDPGHHTAVCGRVSRNLDTWMLTEDCVATTFARASLDADIAIIEGVMGLFDGRGPDDGRGSTADVAKLLKAPVILVVDAAAVAGSIAAVIKGFQEFDPVVQVAGVVCNRVAGPGHYQSIEPVIRRHTKVTPLGWLPRKVDWEIPERHLGLVTADDLASVEGQWQRLGRSLEDTVDVERILAIAGAPPLALKTAALPPLPKTRRRVAVARDAAFCFYYPENLELLEAAGGEVIPFSPLTDSTLPRDINLLYLGGGYPELWAEALARNETLRRSIRAYHQQGGVIYAECGGLMYACRELVDVSGRAFPMLDLLPVRTIMQPRLVTLGYVTFRTTRPTPLGPAGMTARGHEFHYSRAEALEPVSYAAELDRGRGTPRQDGIISGNLLASYAHLHFGSNPAMAQRLLGMESEPNGMMVG
jgi:cobyrinic acid a,c-diamide synthase